MCFDTPDQSRNQKHRTVEEIDDRTLVHAEAMLTFYDPSSPALTKATVEIEKRASRAGVDSEEFRTPYLMEERTPKSIDEAIEAERDLGESEEVLVEEEFVETILAS